MKKAGIQKNIKNLKKIRDILEISKFDTLHKLKEATKISDTYLKMALSARDLILFVEKEFSLKVNKHKSPKNSALWIYITPESELLSVSNAKSERIILRDYDPKKDKMVALGEKAVKFANSHNFELEFFDKHPANHEDSLANTIAAEIVTGNVNEVKFMFNSPKVDDHPIIIHPISEFSVKMDYKKLKLSKDYSFYPSINGSIDSLTEIFIYRVVYAFIRETQFVYLKEKLLRHESSIKNVDERISIQMKLIRKILRKEETEEMIHVAQISKRGDKYE